MTHRTISWNAPYTFSGKEKDVETGYGYFGARYYDSGLSIWLSVDPMSDNTPFATPYAYCINNPIILNDPDGQDWFVNENTGDIYFDEDLKKGSESFVADGKNIKWLGENDMFGQSASSAILGNQDIGTIWNSGIDEAVGRAEFKGKDAAEFADRMGFEKAVASATVKFTTTISPNPSENGPGFNRNIDEDMSNITYTYAKKGSFSTYSSSNRTSEIRTRKFWNAIETNKGVYCEKRNYKYTTNSWYKPSSSNLTPSGLNTIFNIFSSSLDAVLNPEN